MKGRAKAFRWMLKQNASYPALGWYLRNIRPKNRLIDIRAIGRIANQDKG